MFGFNRGGFNGPYFYFPIKKVGVLNEPIVLDSENNIRAPPIEGINLMVDFPPREVGRSNRSQSFDEYKLRRVACPLLTL